VKKAIIVLVLAGSLTTLDAQVKGDSSAVSGQDTVGIAGNFGWVSLHSNPEGAEVYQDTMFLGKTPLVRVRVDEGERAFRLFYPGVGHWRAMTKVDSVTVRRRTEVTSLVDLNGSTPYGPRMEYVPTMQTNPDLFMAAPAHGNSKLWMGYAAGATMVVSGVLSAYLKSKSDKDFDSYIATGDPGLLSSTQRLDRFAGMTLFVTEISLGVLIYLLLAD
jgi:hypothetical protein